MAISVACSDDSRDGCLMLQRNRQAPNLEQLFKCYYYRISLYFCCNVCVIILVDESDFYYMRSIHTYTVFDHLDHRDDWESISESLTYV